MPDSTALRFADTARRLGAAAHEVGLAVPAFRCPPRVAGVDRTIRRYPAGSVVAVRIRDREFSDVAADMVDGVLAANHVPDPDRARLREALASSLVPSPAPSPFAAPPAADAPQASTRTVTLVDPPTVVELPVTRAA